MFSLMIITLVLFSRAFQYVSKSDVPLKAFIVLKPYLLDHSLVFI